MYFFILFDKIEKNRGYLDLGEIQYIGYKDSFLVVDNILREDVHDDRDEHPKYLVVEEIQPGFHQKHGLRKFFQYRAELRAYVEIEEPAALRHIGNFAIG